MSIAKHEFVLYLLPAGLKLRSCISLEIVGYICLTKRLIHK